MTGPTAVIYADSLGNRGGTGVYLRRLLEGLDALETGEVLAAAGGRLLRPAEVLAAGSSMARTGWRKVLAENLSVPRLAASVHPGMVHLPAFGGRAPAGCPFAVTLHDLAFLARPDWFPPLRSVYYRLLFSRTARKADLVMVDSDFTGAEAARLLGIPRERIRRVYLCPGRSGPVFPHGGSVRGVSGPYVLFVGTVEPRKNLAALLDAWPSIAATHPRLTLVVAGRWGWGDPALRSRLQCSPGVVWTGELSGPDLEACLHGSRLLVYPSLYEGFGLPPLEAASAGVPSVVTPAGALTEVFGEVATVCSGFGPAEIAAAVLQALDLPPERDRLLEFASGFGAERMAASVLEAYREVSA